MMNTTKKALVALLVALFIFSAAGCSSSDYQTACKLMLGGYYSEAGESFNQLGDYKDSSTLALECEYQVAKAAYDSGEYETALPLLNAIADYKDSSALAKKAEDFMLKEKLVGSWTASEYDVTEDFLKGLTSTIQSTEGQDAMKYFDFGKLTLSVSLELFDKGTFVMGVDESSFGAMIDSVQASLKTGLRAYFEATVQQLAEESEVTVEELYAFYGAGSFEEFFTIYYSMDFDSYIEACYPRDALVALNVFNSTTGVFTVENGAVSMSVGAETAKVKYDSEADTISLNGETFLGMDLVFSRNTGTDKTA